MTTSKVKEIKNVKPYERDGKTTYYFTIVMENGDEGSIGKKAVDAIKVGDELTYTLEEGQYGKKIKEAGTAFWGKKPFTPRDYKKESVTMAMSYAKDLFVAWKIEDSKKMLATFEAIHDVMCKRFDDLDATSK